MCVYTYESMTDKWIDRNRLHLKGHHSQGHYFRSLLPSTERRPMEETW